MLLFVLWLLTVVLTPPMMWTYTYAVRCGNSICEGSERASSDAFGPVFLSWAACFALAVGGTLFALVRRRRRGS